MAILPLSNVRVLDLSRVLAGPLAGQMLADLGADVIKVERPGTGDDSRVFGAPYLTGPDGHPTRENAFYLSANRNKKSVTVNIACAQGQDIIRRLAAKADVVLENYKVGDLKRYGLDYDAIRALNPGVIYCSVTGYGQSGPYAKKPGYDAVFQGQSGLMSVTGLPDHKPGGGPMKVGPSIADVITGLNVSNAILAALYSRDANGGTGQFIDVALLDCMVAALSHYAQIYLTSGEVPVRRGTQGNGGMPSTLFPCSDGAIMLTAGNDVQYGRLCDAVERPDLAAHPLFHTNILRVENRDALTAEFDAIFRRNTVAHWLERLEAFGIPSGPINTLDQVFADPQMRHRGMAVAAPHPLAPDLQVLRNPLHFSATPITRYDAPPMLGQHTDAVLADELGFDADTLARLRAEGVI
ncbi:CaiB/BaiF CoA transferase family protein [Nitrospirillum viridazoti]|uniref:CoA transferase n=1 Tax=Nitrospirillum viridazoti CBAmc TaxID=1441467 RepID=A0A248JUC6_9PROT|nr:CaiB/BaiF CoA-transferase family protein [Nitrospirillum amazonense]ASG22209.1 CoA transferase [Nitrospirillum amazonense CBAmc]TWB31026.1 crotonobetainyl-CoA:carnitine CoA-transferase CaiB-like acyl-CoA transferase [Nitrospirillum amazonense]